MIRKGNGERGTLVTNDRKKRVLRAGALQILWALLLVYIILFGLAMRFGSEIGYALSFLVCGGVAAMVTIAFLAIYLTDRGSAYLTGRYEKFIERQEQGTLRGKDQSVMKKIIRTSDAPRAIGPYSQAVEAGGFVFVSGQIPLDPTTGNIISGDIREQTKRVMENGKAILTAAGFGMDRVVKTTIYLKNIGDFAAVNEVYGSYFTSDPPARATVEVSRLPKDVAIEIDFIAVKI